METGDCFNLTEPFTSFLTDGSAATCWLAAGFPWNVGNTSKVGIIKMMMQIPAIVHIIGFILAAPICH
ncbi:hypothetical protein BACI9J_60693 [Bacillus altitudinis]|nr:hypothetical protein BACI9J_60693 [Bacillus altitudinis]